jgi:diguanylate cyclase (GGDEF)-like protein
MLSIGWSLVAASFLIDVFDELEFISALHQIIDMLDLFVEKPFLLLGMIIISHGFYSTILKQNRLLNTLKYTSSHDSLTRLPNKDFIIKELTRFIDHAHKQSSLIAVLFIDLDNFKILNDTFGHSFGDLVLQKVTERLNRLTDDKIILARISGDEFLIIVHSLYSVDAVEEMAKKILNQLHTPIKTEITSVHISCSIGISMFPYDGCTVDTLIKNADMAMYRAKSKGKNRYNFYDSAMGEAIALKQDTSEKIREALGKNEFILHYQPKAALRNNEITGIEALVRWTHPDLGLLYPNNFIPIAEETGLIKEIDKLVLKLVCLQIKNWENKGLAPVNISINISAALFKEENFLNMLDQILVETAADPTCISIEITETLAIEDIHHTAYTLGEIQKRNIKILLDDFGKGYSSLSYLKELPIDVLKIDKQFIDGISKSQKDEAIIKAIVAMAKALEIQVLPEGVETSQQLEFLGTLGCNEFQGYLFSKPLPAHEIEDTFLSAKSGI